MAKVYGILGSEKVLVQKCSESIESFDDVNTLLNKFEKNLGEERILFYNRFDELKEIIENKKKAFFSNLPSRIAQNKNELNILKDEEQNMKKFWDDRITENKNKIKNIKKNIVQDKKLYLILLLLINYIKLFVKTKISQPNQVAPFTEKVESKKDEIRELKHNPQIVFEREEVKLVNKFNRFDMNPEQAFKENNEELIDDIKSMKNIKSFPEYLGAVGEYKVLFELSKLSDEYHILSDINIELDRYYTYNGQKYNLKSAQIDFVIVCYKGVFLIEVKNWSNKYIRIHSGISPYEQIDRAGRVLYKHLKEYLPRDVSIQKKVTKLLVPVQNNMEYNKTFKSVMVKNIPNINYYLKNKRDVLSEYEVKEIILVLLSC